MQYGHCTACATASAISAFSRSVSAPSAKTASYQDRNFFHSSGAPVAHLGKAGKIGGVVVVLVIHGDPVAYKGKAAERAWVGGSSASIIES